MLLHYLVKWRNTKIAFSLNCCISALSEFNQLLDLFNLFDSRLIFTLLYDSLNLVINADGCHFEKSLICHNSAADAYEIWYNDTF